MEFQSSRTFQNLQNAYELELQSDGRYDIFDSRAKEENLIGIARTFGQLSINSNFIANRLKRIINNGVTSTEQNLEEASQVALLSSNMYRQSALIAREEGFDNLEALFSGIANIKLNHHLIFQEYVEDINNNELFCKPEERLWICLGCGNILSGECAPEICPICLYPQGYYQLYQ